MVMGTDLVAVKGGAPGRRELKEGNNITVLDQGEAPSPKGGPLDFFFHLPCLADRRGEERGRHHEMGPSRRAEDRDGICPHY